MNAKCYSKLDIGDKRMLSIKEAAQYLGLGTRTTRVYMDKIGATVKFGGRVVFDRTVIDSVLDQKVSKENE